MLKDFFQRNIDLTNQLRSQHFKYSQYLNKGKYKLKQKFFGKGKKHYDFDINSQQYFHQEIQDITFQSSQAQQEFFNLVNGAINRPFNVQSMNKSKNKLNYDKESLIPFGLNISSPSQCRLLLARHFFTRIHNLQYKKYLILSRYHNCLYQKKQQQVLPFVQSRTTIIDKQIQVAMSRQVRLSCQDYFQESFTQGGKPIPISQTGQPIYKYLDEEQCWYSNISRDDIIVYTRNQEFRREVLNQFYYPIQSELKAIVLRDGIEIYLAVEEEFQHNSQVLSKEVSKIAEEFNSLVQRQLEIISPGNLVEKQNLSNFGYTIFGILSNTPLTLPLYPAIYPELLDVFRNSSKLFFKNLEFKTHQNIIYLLPKLNSFCQILFKYQNHQVLQGKKQIKLGLEDDIDVRKQLYTMLQEVWVRRHVKLAFQRFDYKLQLKSVDWPLDSISQELSRQHNRKKKSSNIQKSDTSCQQLIKLLSFTDFLSFRRHMKKRSQKIIQRCGTKYYDMEQINKFNQKSSQKMTLQELSDLFRMKFDKDQTSTKQKFLKPAASMFFQQIMKNYWVSNPAQIQIQQTLKFLKIRQDRVKIINVLNGIRCYHRNLSLDLRVQTGEQFKFKLEDQFLINSNKQVVQSFERAVKETATFFTKNSDKDKNGQVSQEFYLPQNNYERSMIYKKDIVKCHYYNEQSPTNNTNDAIVPSQNVPHVLVSSGRRTKSQILYGCVIQNDLPLTEQRIISACTSIINRYERFIKITSRDELVDRVQLLRLVFQFQLKYLFQKFKLIEKYYYLYENTTGVLQAFKISKLIVGLIHKNVDLQVEGLMAGIKWQDLYNDQIDQLREEEQVIEKMIVRLKKEETMKVETFHHRFCEQSRIPLSAQIYLYRDIQPKQSNKNRLQRMNSISSKMSSKSSKGAHNKSPLAANQQIRQQFDEDDSDGAQSFDIQNYDQYLLKKDMDAIFDDMIQVDENKEQVPINTAVQQNIVVNPRYEGGPHPYNYVCEHIKLTSQYNQNLLNFYQTLSFAANVHEIIKHLQRQYINTYGYVSPRYQQCLLKVLTSKMNKILLQPLKTLKKWKQFQSYDPYHQIVTQSSKHYQEIISPALEPPSNIQMAIASTLQKHQEKLPPFSTLAVFDYYSIQSLICLKKPVNSASYRELALGINYITFLNIKQGIYHIQLKRQKIIQAYQKLALNCGSVAERFGAMYSRSGQSDVLLSIQQIKQYKDDLYTYPVLPEVIQQLKIIIECQKSDTQLFQTIVKCSKIKVQDYIIMKHEVGKHFLNSRFNNDRLLAKDQKTIKMIKNRITGEISNICQQQFKRNSFLKIKQQLKIKVEKSIKQVLQADLSSKLTFPKQKLSQYSKQLLEDKLKRKLVIQVIEAYSKDLVDTNLRNKIFVETDSMLRRLHKLINCAPYLKKTFIFASNQEQLNSRVFYDQKKQQNHIKHQTEFIRQGKITKPVYIYSRQQLSNEWSQQETLFRSNNLNEFKIHPFDFSPPKQKDHLFKWIYRIQDYSFSEHQRKAYQLFISKLSLPFTGKASQSEYLEKVYEADAPRNRFYSIYSYYQILLAYLQKNFLLVSLQMQDDILESFSFILSNDNIIFEDIFPLKDQVSIHESLASLQKKYLKTCYNYKETRQSDKLTIKKRIEQKRYTQNKQHWTVFDEILDFIIAKVQGRGVIRENFLPLAQEIESIFKNVNESSNDVQELLKLRTEQIDHYFVLSTIQAYFNEQYQNSENQATFYHYLFPLHKWFLGNGLENYRLISNSSNQRYNISSIISTDQKQIQRFILGLSCMHNANLTKNASVMQRYKSVLLLNSPQLQSYIQELFKNRLNPYGSNNNNSLSMSQTGKNNSINNNNSAIQQKSLSMFNSYNFSFLPQGVSIFYQMGQTNRLKIFSRMRFYYEKSFQYLKLKSTSTKPIEMQETKLNYIKFLLNSKNSMISTIVFSDQSISFPVSSKVFKQTTILVKQAVDISTYTIFDKFQQYKSENKIQFGKTELKLLQTSEQNKKNDKLRQIYNNLIRDIIHYKLMREQFKSRALLESIKVLKNQKLPQIQQKKIINTSLIPRVHLISSYSSPLILQRKTFISQQYKLAFAQAFINRFRNKVSRVDLLSSGYGFVITVPDLQDCVNFMNKLLFTFAQKQFKYRLQTNQQYFQIMVEAVNEKNKVINQQKEIIKHLQQKVTNIMQAEYLGKVTKLLHEKTVIQDKLRAIQQSTNGLQDRIRKTVQIQYEKKVASLQAENQLLRNKFNEFKQLFVILTKDTAKNNFLTVANTIREKVGDLLNKRIDVKQSFLTSEDQKPLTQNNKKSSAKYQENQLEQKKQSTQPKQVKAYTSQDLQRCKLGQDIIHDPYYTTKLITKMRLFNIFKLGCKKIHFEQIQTMKTSELKQLHKIQDTVIAQSQRQILVRQELKRTQEQMSKKVAQFQKLKQSYDLLDNQRTKLKILITGKDKKIQQRQRQAVQNNKKIQQLQKLPSLPISQSKIDKQEQRPKISQLRKIHKKKSTHIQKSPFVTSVPIQPSISVYDRFQLSNKDSTWREKCQQLYIENKKLLGQLQKVQSGLTTPTRDGFSLNLRQRKKSESFNLGSLGSQTIPLKKEEQNKRFPNLAFKYNLMKQANNSNF